MPTKADVGSTLAGAGAGMALMATVRWEQIPQGEAVKLGVAILLLALGAILYRQPPKAA